jgi:ANTAR domain-containing protein
LQAALNHRSLIEQAKAILMASDAVDAATAFERLGMAARSSHRRWWTWPATSSPVSPYPAAAAVSSSSRLHGGRPAGRSRWRDATAAHAPLGSGLPWARYTGRVRRLSKPTASALVTQRAGAAFIKVGRLLAGFPSQPVCIGRQTVCDGVIGGRRNSRDLLHYSSSAQKRHAVAMSVLE